MKVADLTVEELRTLIKNTVHEELHDLLADPDVRLELRQEMQARLAASMRSTERIAFDEIQRRLNLH